MTTTPNHSRYRRPCLYAVSSAAPGPIGRQRLAIVQNTTDILLQAPLLPSSGCFCRSGASSLKHRCGSAAVRACGRSDELWTPCQDALLPAILTVRRHWLPVTACKRAIVIPDIADAPIDIREGCPLFPSVGKTAHSAVFHSCVGAATAIRSLWRRLGTGGLHEHRASDQERCKRTDGDFCFHGRSFRGV